MRTALAYSVTLATLIAPLPALADISAQDTWDNWKSYLESSGYKIEARSEQMVGTSLILRDVALILPTPDVNMRASIENIEMREQGDGSVMVTLSDNIPVSMSAPTESDQAVDITLMIKQSGLEILASGDPDSVTYDYSANSVAIDFDKFFVEDETVDPTLDISATGIRGKTHVAKSDMQRVQSSSAIEGVSVSFAVVDPSEDVDLSFEMQLSDLISDSTATLPLEIDINDPTWMFTSGFDVDAKVSVGQGSSSVSMKGEESFDIITSTESSEFAVAITDGTMAYSVGSKGASYGFSSADMPMPPINVAMDEVSFGVKMPLTPSEDAKEFGFITKLVNLTTDEFLWSMIDPGQALPRDPATLIIDLQGMANVTSNLMDPEQTMALEANGELPFEIESLSVNELSLSVAGARVIGLGDFTFDNTDLETYDGFPAPTGTMNIDIYGVNGLLDTLVSMGLIPDEQAMGTRMMMGAFARPGDGDDHLTSEIKVEGGSVFANGMQLQ